MNRRGIIEMNMSVFTMVFALSFMLLLIVYSYFYYGYKAQRMAHFASTQLVNIDTAGDYEISTNKLQKIISSDFSEDAEVTLSTRRTHKNSTTLVATAGHSEVDCKIHDTNILNTLSGHGDQIINVVNVCLYFPEYHISIARQVFTLKPASS